ncbi:uncharacterized protein [Littorina saxatilis]|uniref:Uncharacterized protein n=1 Tax=Littorina saxatilis TaxID=31220 RepID=A0AAN9BY86_9CAEN
MSLKRLFSREGSRKGVVDYSARRSMIETPPPGHLTDRHDPHKLIWKPQSSKGDQADESRIPFFNSGFTTCPKCGECDVWRFEETAGIRENGDTYGTETFRCQTKGCKWKTSFKYDNGVPYCIHFEARAWPRGIHFYPVTFMMRWCERHGLDNLKHQVFSRNIDGDAFLTLYHSGQMKAALNLSSKTVSKVKKALEQRDGALLTKTNKKK